MKKLFLLLLLIPFLAQAKFEQAYNVTRFNKVITLKKFNHMYKIRLGKFDEYPNLQNKVSLQSWQWNDTNNILMVYTTNNITAINYMYMKAFERFLRSTKTPLEQGKDYVVFRENNGYFTIIKRCVDIYNGSYLNGS